MNNFLLLTCLLNFYFFQPPVHKEKNSKDDLTTMKFHDQSPSMYFSKHIIPADTEIINHNDSTSTTFSIGNHRIKWKYSAINTFVSIDNYRFEISKRHTLNNVSLDSQNDSLAKGYVLYETKSFTYKNHEILGFEFGVASCEGFNCRLDYQLFYDMSTLSINFFGEYHAGNSVDLYSFNDSPGPDFISVNYLGNPWGEDTCHFVYNLYSLDAKGEFVKGKDQDNNDYFISTKCANFYGDCKIESKNWFEPIE